MADYTNASEYLDYADYPDDIVSGCIQYLNSFSDIVSLVGSDAAGSWIFDSAPAQNMNSTSAMCIVVYNAGSWGTPAPGQTAEFPRVGIDIWSDPPRDSMGQVTEPQAARRAADLLYRTIDRHMNRTDRGVVMFGDLYTWDSNRMGSINYLPVIPSDDHLLKGTAYYAVETAFFFDS